MKKKLLLQDLSEFIVQSENLNKKEADIFVRSFFDIIEQGLLEDKFVKIKGLGTFKLVAVNERESVNINTGERFQISGHTKVTFTPDASMKEMVNKPFAHFEAVDLSEDTDMQEFDLIDQEMAAEEQATEPNFNNKALEETNEKADSQTPATNLTLNDSDKPNSLVESFTNAVKPHTSAPQDTNNPTTNTTSAADTCQPLTSELLPENKVTEPTSLQTTPAAANQVQAQTTTDNPIKATTPHSPTPNTIRFDIETEEPISQTADPQQESAQNNEDNDNIVTASNHPNTTTPATTNTKAENTDTQPQSTASSHHRTPATSHTSSSIGYTYNEVPSRRKRNWWKIACIAIGAIALMSACYFAGYFRLLCPCSIPGIESWLSPTHSEQHSTATANPNPTTQSTYNQQPNNSSADPNNRTKQQEKADECKNTDSPSITNTMGIPAVSNTNSPAQSSNKTEIIGNSTSEQSNEKHAEQTEKNKAARTHTIKAGDTLLKISRKYYGTDKYVKVIMKRNKLRDANNIPLGKTIILP